MEPDPLTSLSKGVMPKGIHIEPDGIYDKRLSQDNKRWLLIAVFLSCSHSAAHFLSGRSGDDFAYRAGVYWIITALIAVYIAFDRWRPAHQKGRPVLQLATPTSLVFTLGQGWAGKQAVALDKPRELTIGTFSGRKSYTFRPVDRNSLALTETVIPEWSEELATVADMWLRELARRGLINMRKQSDTVRTPGTN